MPEFVELQIDGHKVHLEYKRIPSPRQGAPLIVFLHEGLGSLSMWGDWPERLCCEANAAGLVFSRYGYGNSTPRTSHPWPTDYLEHEAQVMLPALLEALGINPREEKLILFGHSDGGSISLLYAAAYPDQASAVIAIAPHEFVEDVGRARIASLKSRFYESPLADILSAHHADPLGVFRGWSELWLSSRFRDWNIEERLARITSPLLVVQGAQDQYATLRQVHAVTHRVPHAASVILDNCRHIPHQEQPDKLLQHVCSFLSAFDVRNVIGILSRSSICHDLKSPGSCLRSTCT